MSATEPRHLRADARRNRERIVEAARVVLGRDGPSAQMDDVAREAGVGVGTVYRHFPTKEVLVGEIIRAKFRHHVEVARRWEATAEGWAAFEGMVREVVAAMATDASQQRLMWTDDDRALIAAEEERLELVAVVRRIIERAQAAGELRADFGVDDMPTIMCGLGGAMSTHSRFTQGWERLVGFILDGLRT